MVSSDPSDGWYVMKRLVGLLVLGIVIGVVGGCKKSAKEEISGKWQLGPGGPIVEVLPDGTVTSDGKVTLLYEILEDGRLKTWAPAAFPRGVEIFTIAFVGDTLVAKHSQVDSTFLRTFGPTAFDTTRVGKWVRVK